MSKETQTPDISALTTEQLEEQLRLRKETEKKAQKKLENDFEKDKEDFILSTVRKFVQESNELKELKLRTITEANLLHNRMWEIQGKEPKAQQTFSLKTETMKITVDRQERFEFTEEANVHIQSIKDIMREKFEGRNKGFYAVLESILMRNSKGDLDPKLLTKARKQVNDLGYPELITEFEKLENCQRVNGTSLYCRAYKKDEQGKWKDINVQFSSL